MTRKKLDARARVLRDARAFFDSRGYIEVETPVIVPSPGLDVHLDAFEVTAAEASLRRPSDPPRYLSTSPEYQMKRLLADGHERIFQITRAFRAGELGERHNPEFTILEFYRARAGVEEIMRDTEQLVARVTGGAASIEGRGYDLRPPFARLTVCEAYQRFAKVSADETHAMAEHDEDRFYRLLVDVVEPAIAAEPRAIFLTEYPATQASLARKKAADPRVAERFELYVAGVELCNGFGELTDPDEQRSRFEHDRAERARRGKAVYPIDERFLDALARGMPASGGNALGLDRLAAIAAGVTSIRELIAFTADEL